MPVLCIVIIEWITSLCGIVINFTELSDGFGWPSDQKNLVFNDNATVECKALKYTYNKAMIYIVEGLVERPVENTPRLTVRTFEWVKKSAVSIRRMTEQLI